jgi:predicted mannosyl-3-phosphoglycerate phosphatase (HAD superfamily)
MMSVTNALNAYAEHAKELPAISKDQERELYLNTIRAAFERLTQAFGRKNYGDMSDDEIAKSVAKKVNKLSAVEPDEEMSELASSIDEETLVGLMED